MNQIEPHVNTATTNNPIRFLSIENDGYLILWVDGEHTGQRISLDTVSRHVEYVMLGAPGGLDAGTNGTIYFDNFQYGDAMQDPGYAEFVYDGDGNRVVTKTPQGITALVGENFQWETGGITTTYYTAGTQKVAMRKGSDVYYLLGDHLGSSSLTVNDTGTKVGEQWYYPFGEVRYVTSTLQTRYTFTGQYSEPDLGLMNYRARYYDPYLNHFTQPDTIIPDPNNPQDWNRYSYVQYNPINLRDPSGHWYCGDQYDYACAEDYSEQQEAFWNETNYIHQEIGGTDDVEAMAQIAEAAVAIFSGSIMSEYFAMAHLTEAFTGVFSNNPFTLPTAALNRGLAKINSSVDKGLKFTDRGFHNDFKDPNNNQVFHVWPYVVQGYNGTIGSAVGVIGNMVHEDYPSYGGDDDGQSQEDYDLAGAGMLLGNFIRRGYFSLDQLGDGIRLMFGAQGPGAFWRDW